MDEEEEEEEEKEENSGWKAVVTKVFAHGTGADASSPNVTNVPTISQSPFTIS